MPARWWFITSLYFGNVLWNYLDSLYKVGETAFLVKKYVKFKRKASLKQSYAALSDCYGVRLIYTLINLHKKQYSFDNKKAIFSSNYTLVCLWILPDI